MSTAEMTKRVAEASPRFKARLAGVFEALEGLTSAFGQVLVLGRLVVSGNAAATAANILGHERLFWLGFASSLIAVPFHIAWTLLFYDLFKPVNRSLSLLAAFVMLVGCGIQALTSLLHLAPLLVLTGGSSLSAFTAEQLQALALVFLKLNAHAFEIFVVFFGLWCVLTGYLIFRSTFLPRILGVLLAIDGLGWVTFLSPSLGHYLFPFLVRDKLIVPRDATATANNIMASESLWRVAFAGTLIMLVCAVALTLIFYVLLRPVNRNIALLVAFFNLVSIAIEGMNDLYHFAAVLILGGADYLKAFEPHQLQALALLSAKFFAYGYGISLVFFGFESLFRGYLIFKSGYFPRFLGVLVIISGLSYVSNSFALFLIRGAHFDWLLVPTGVPELILCLWLIVRGVNVPKWQEKASAGGASGV